MNAKMQIRESQVNVNMITESNNTPSPKTQGKEKKEKNILKKHQQDERTIKMIQPQDVEYVSLTVTNGSLAVASSSQGSYYRAWNSNGKILFEFFSDKTAKAINNRSVIIDPFCDKALESLSADDASNIETCQFGTLNNDYTLISKTIIKFV
ncbi:MAG: hypothetical protein K6G32_02815 [Prevotella sp.]|nr:hypothetical protein [Prevotella sp.]